MRFILAAAASAVIASGALAQDIPPEIVPQMNEWTRCVTRAATAAPATGEVAATAAAAMAGCIGLQRTWEAAYRQSDRYDAAAWIPEVLAQVRSAATRIIRDRRAGAAPTPAPAASAPGRPASTAAAGPDWRRLEPDAVGAVVYYDLARIRQEGPRVTVPTRFAFSGTQEHGLREALQLVEFDCGNRTYVEKEWTHTRLNGEIERGTAHPFRARDSLRPDTALSAIFAIVCARDELGRIVQVGPVPAVRVAYLGVGVQPLPQELAETFNLAPGVGALVTGTNRNSPAERAGLARGDVIVRFGGDTITREQPLAYHVTNRFVGEEVRIDLIRDGQPRSVSAAVMERPTQEEIMRNLPPG